jgi:hypothetical protein
VAVEDLAAGQGREGLRAALALADGDDRVERVVVDVVIEKYMPAAATLRQPQRLACVSGLSSAASARAQRWPSGVREAVDTLREDLSGQQQERVPAH